MFFLEEEPPCPQTNRKPKVLDPSVAGLFKKKMADLKKKKHILIFTIAQTQYTQKPNAPN